MILDQKCLGFLFSQLFIFELSSSKGNYDYSSSLSLSTARAMKIFLVPSVAYFGELCKPNSGINLEHRKNCCWSWQSVRFIFLVLVTTIRDNSWLTVKWNNYSLYLNLSLCVCPNLCVNKIPVTVPVLSSWNLFSFCRIQALKGISHQQSHVC